MMSKLSLPFIKVSRVIHTSPEKLWDLLTDTTRWTEWGPSIHNVQCEHRYIRAGSKGRIRTVFGFWAPFVITEWAHQKYWSWRVFNIRATGHRIESIDTTCCRLIFEVPFWAAPYIVVCKLAADRIARCMQPAMRKTDRRLNLD